MLPPFPTILSILHYCGITHVGIELNYHSNHHPKHTITMVSHLWIRKLAVANQLTPPLKASARGLSKVAVKDFTTTNHWAEKKKCLNSTILF